jgi:hypothetical protein
LNGKAQLLARIRAWLTLESPPGQESFPYHLAMRNVDTGEFHTAGDMRENEKYKIYLKADEAALKNAQNLTPRWVYVFAIDHFGACTLLYPASERGNEGNEGNEGNRQPYAQFGEQPKVRSADRAARRQIRFQYRRTVRSRQLFSVEHARPHRPGSVQCRRSAHEGRNAGSAGGSTE